MTIHVGILMDPISKINIKKDSSFALLLAAQKRGFKLFYFEASDIWLDKKKIFGNFRSITVRDDVNSWFELGEAYPAPLSELQVLLMRLDPPIDMHYIYLTYLLEQAEKEGVWVINKPQSLRDANEKLFCAWFPQCCPDTLVTSQMNLLKQFVKDYQQVIIKPLGAMAGRSVFYLNHQDHNVPVIIETVTDYGKNLVMMQQFIPEISQGDKRIILIDGKPIPYALARVPHAEDFRGNLAAGAIAKGQNLSARDEWICDQVGAVLQEKGLLIVGLDIIGNYLTEINVTSPTGIRQLDEWFELDIGGKLMDVIEWKIGQR